jgi:hypothetical protein
MYEASELNKMVCPPQWLLLWNTKTLSDHFFKPEGFVASCFKIILQKDNTKKPCMKLQN